MNDEQKEGYSKRKIYRQERERQTEIEREREAKTKKQYQLSEKNPTF